MKNPMLAMLIGGVLPALLFGVSGVIQKACARTGIGTGPYLAIAGLVVAAVGLLFTIAERDATVNRAGLISTALFGACWASGIGCIAIALRRLGGQISQLVPLYNMNTLVAVLIGLVVLAEWRDVLWGRLLMASALIVAGGVLAASSSR